MQNDFFTSLSALQKKLGSHAVMVLSTSCDDKVTSRPMSVVVCDGKFYFQTDKTFLKCRQLMKNPNASLCVNNYSITGVCRFIGKPLDEKNRFFLNLFKKYFYASYKLYSHTDNEVLIEFTPKVIYSWIYRFTKPYVEYWDFENKIYRIEEK